MLRKILEYIEENINLEQKETAKNEVIKALQFKNTRDIVIYESTERKFEPLNYADTFENMENMLYNELVPIANNLTVQDDMIYSIRSNYGVGTLPSLFGAENTLVNETAMPWCGHLSRSELVKVINNGVPPLNNGLGNRVIETYEYYLEVLSHYPRVQQGVALYHPDLQGPFDTAHLLFGSEIYMELYDDPSFIHQLLELITETYIKFMRKYLQVTGTVLNGYCYHWNTMYRGNVLLRNDSAVNFSTAMYEEFAMQYDDMIAEEFGGAAMHYCGQNESWLPTMLKEAKIQSLNFGNVPSKSYGKDFLKIVKELADVRKIPIAGYVMTQREFDDIQDNSLKCGTTFTVKQ